MRDTAHPSNEEYARIGYTATGRTRHIIDDYSKPGRAFDRSVCNTKVRDLDDMMEEFDLNIEDIEELDERSWCTKCEKWLRTMTHLQSQGKKTAVPDAVLDVWSEEFGFTKSNTGLAVVIDMAEWKKAHGRS